MQEFMNYLAGQIEAGRAEIERLEADGRKDDANFARVRTNIYDVCRTVTNTLANRPGAGEAAVKAQFARFETTWGAALEKAKAHGDAGAIAVEETKLAALADVVAHFPEGQG